MVLLWMINHDHFDLPYGRGNNYIQFQITPSTSSLDITRDRPFDEAVLPVSQPCLAALTERVLANSSYFYVKSAYLPK